MRLRNITNSWSIVIIMAYMVSCSKQDFMSIEEESNQDVNMERNTHISETEAVNIANQF